MKLLFIHGAPASGKLTVAKALLQAVPGKLFDNHAAIDVARTVFEFGAPGFWELIHDVRCKVLEAAAAQDTPLLVTTFCYAEPDDLTSFTELEPSCCEEEASCFRCSCTALRRKRSAASAIRIASSAGR